MLKKALAYLWVTTVFCVVWALVPVAFLCTHEDPFRILCKKAATRMKLREHTPSWIKGE